MTSSWFFLSTLNRKFRIFVAHEKWLTSSLVSEKLEQFEREAYFGQFLKQSKFRGEFLASLPRGREGYISIYVRKYLVFGVSANSVLASNLKIFVCGYIKITGAFTSNYKQRHFINAFLTPVKPFPTAPGLETVRKSMIRFAHAYFH